MAITVTNPTLNNFSDDNFLLPHKPLAVESDDIRNGNQCKYATRFTTVEMLPVVSAMDRIGFASMEIWGGATFDAAIRFCEDDPWERLRLFKALMPRTKAKMLLRGQNLVGYHPYADDIVEKFVELAAKNGIDIFCVFDGMNDTRNCETAIKAVKESGKHCRGCITYAVSPVHCTEKYVEIAKEYERLGCDSIGFADQAGILTPPKAFEIVKALKNNLSIPVVFTACCTGGMSEISYWEAIRAGADIITTCFASFAGGSSEPAVESISAALINSPADTGFNLEELTAVNTMLKQICKNHEDAKTTFANCNPDVLRHQVPGGMLSNLESQLKALNVYDRMGEVFKEIEIVYKDMGYPNLATPFSQMVGAQATANVLTGKRYGLVSKEVKAYVAGKYGKSLGPISEELKEIVLRGSEPETARPGSLIEPGWKNAVEESKEFAKCEEDVMTYALFPDVAESFLRKRYGIKKK